MSDSFPIVEVPPDAQERAHVEPMGTKRKFWYRASDQTRWLFKYNRPGHGEDWAEKIACEIAELLGLPHAVVELATCDGEPGVVARDFVPKGFRLVHGNELLVEHVDPEYPKDQNFKVCQHNLPNVFQVLEAASIALPSNVSVSRGVESAGGLLVGYLLLDAVISNTDRHHENWAILERSAKEGALRVAELAPTFDHASSLGRNELDRKRELRLDGRDPQFTVATYVAKAASRVYATDTDERPLSPLEAFGGASQFFPKAGRAWLVGVKPLPWRRRRRDCRSRSRSSHVDRGSPLRDTDGRIESGGTAETMPLTVPNLAEALFVAWQNPGTRRFHAVGRLAYLPDDSGGLYEFAYIRGTCEADEAGFRPFLAFPDLHRVYRSNALFPFFANRLMPRSRPEYAEFLSWLDLDPETATPIQILGRSGGSRVTDEVELFPLPAFDGELGGYRTHFLVHGLRYMPSASQERVMRLEVDEQLFWYLDCQNPADSRAIALRTDDRHNVGFIPSYLLDEAWSLLQSCEFLDVFVARVSPLPAPLAQRVLCEIQSCWPDDFVPLAAERFQPISSEAACISARPDDPAAPLGSGSPSD